MLLPCLETQNLWPSEVNVRYEDLDEVAGATDAIACSYRSYFLRSNSPPLGDNRARYAAHEFLIDPASATSEAIKRRNDHSIPINKDMTGPRPPQTPATSSKSPYRKCAGGMLFRSPRMFCAGALVDRVPRFIAKCPTMQSPNGTICSEFGRTG